MENASKALIIAGAILISILLISVGIIIMNAINDPVQQGAQSAESSAAEIFNSNFSLYAGEQKGSTVRQLITKILSSNGSDSKHQIYLDKTSKYSELLSNGAKITTTNISASSWGKYQSSCDNEKTYNVEFSFADSDNVVDGNIRDIVKIQTESGYIYKVKITEK